ncbi:Tlg1p [Sugiyamaella lignohabitans]|uniref:t-SNARE affecting a late Golgi compartment protein 1 n=1 Tax=Sugiyamaella lignohabitans TaxID=796027 RepID=A0A167C8U7_9ASCO|nr:Tlg1p [Sugiyamaella lignohabitans]ANB11369.1 Tlg1p [Sugiyamaella lignohabitans]
MDPFNQVYADAQAQLIATEKLLAKYQSEPTNNHLIDVNNCAQELVETIHDLSQSIGVVQQTPSQFGVTEHEVNDRISKVALLNNKLADIQQVIPRTKAAAHPDVSTWNSGNGDSGAAAAATGPAGDAAPAASPYQGNGGGLESNLMYQDMIQEQDTVLDSVFTTVNSLREQANVMSRELEDQSYLIEDFDRQVDTAGDRLRRGLKKVDWVVKNNRETLSSCCITLLIVVLIILLVLVIVL